MLVPQIGQRVHFFTPGYQVGKDQPLAALITKIWAHDLVNLVIFDENGQLLTSGNTSIPLLQDGTEIPAKGGYCAFVPEDEPQSAETMATRGASSKRQPQTAGKT